MTMSATHYLYRVQLTRPAMLTDGATAEEEAIMSQHFQWLHHQMEQGVLILAGRTLNTDESSFGIVIFKAPSLEEARALMNSAPAIRHGIFRAELFPYQIALLKESNV